MNSVIKITDATYNLSAISSYSNYDIIFEAFNVFGSNQWIMNVNDYKKFKPEYIGESNFNLELSNNEVIFNFDDYFHPNDLIQDVKFSIQEYDVYTNIIREFKKDILNRQFSLESTTYVYLNYTLVVNFINVYGSNSLRFNIIDYEKTKPIIINPIITFELSDVNIHYNINENVELNSLLQYYEKVSNFYEGVQLSNNIISIYNCNVERTCNITIGVGNVWDMNLFTIIIHEWEHVKPRLIRDTNLSIVLADENINYPIDTIFAGLIESFYIIENPTGQAKIINNSLEFNGITEYSNYDIVIESSNRFGSNQWTVIVENLFQGKPTLLTDLVKNLFLSNQTIIYNLEDIFIINEKTVEIDYFMVLSNPGLNANIENNILTITPYIDKDYSNFYQIIAYASNIFGSNVVDFYVTDYKKSEPEFINDLSYTDLYISNQIYIKNIDSIFSGLIEKTYILQNIYPEFNNIQLTDSNITITNDNIEQTTSNYYDLIIGTCNVFGSNEFAFHITKYKRARPEYIGENSKILELSNQRFNINLNNIFSGLIEIILKAEITALEAIGLGKTISNETYVVELVHLIYQLVMYLVEVH